MTDQIKIKSAEQFKRVESLCGITRLGIFEAMSEASGIEDEELKDDAIETIAGTINEFITMFKGEPND